MTRDIVIAVALFVAGNSTLFADPIDIRVARSVSAIVAFTDDSFLGARESDGADSTSSGIFRVSREVTAQTDLARLSVAAAQDTNFDPFRHRLTGSGTISAGPNSTAGIAEVDRSVAISEVSLDFALARATPFQFRGLLVGADGAIVQATIEGSGFNASAFSGPVSVAERGVLQPGSYRFFTRATLGENIPSITGAASFDIDFRLGSAATPEPASLSLLATGIAVASVGRRRTRQRQQGC